MHTYFLPGVFRYLSSHSEVAITATSSAVALVLLLVLLVAREALRQVDTTDPAGRAVDVRRFTIAVTPLALVGAVVVFERFRLLS